MVPSFSIHLSLCSTGFRRLPGSYEEIRLLRGHRPVVVASFGSTAHADPRRPPWVRTLDVPPLPPLLPSRPRLDFGRRVRRHADPAGSACSGVYFRSVLRFASGFFPTRPRGARVIGVSRRQTLRAVASGSRLLPTRPAKDFHLQSSAHARHTSAETARRRGADRRARRRRGCRRDARNLAAYDPRLAFVGRSARSRARRRTARDWRAFIDPDVAGGERHDLHLADHRHGVSKSKLSRVLPGGSLASSR